MVSREPTWAKKVPRIRLEMVSREPTWAKKVPTWAKKAPRIAQSFKRAWAKKVQLQESQLGKEGPKDRLEMVSREPTWAKKVPRNKLEIGGLVQESQLGQRSPKARLEMVSRDLGKEGPKEVLD